LSVAFVDIGWAGSAVRIEHAWVGVDDAATPLIVFLHEGLGSLAMWKDFPQALCAAAGCRGLVYSRPGYGRSTARVAEEAWGLDFLHHQALEVLPALMKALRLTEPYWLLGHSDGGSIALLHAAHFPQQVAGVVVVAPHIFVEDRALTSIEQARVAFETTDMKERLAKYHDDPDSAFYRWNRIWLHPPFRQWTIEAEIGAIQAPLLAVQGLDDEYGTLEQIRGIARRLPHTQLLQMADCGHSPQRDQPQALIDAASAFIHRHNILHGDTA
jgi:pimeloyl-ACP methyl ester carboxylesterase